MEPAKVKREEDWVQFETVKKLAVVICFTCLIEIAFPQAYGKMGGEAYVSVPAQVGWWLMEFPVSFVFAYLFWWKTPNKQPVQVLLGALLTGHYLCTFLKTHNARLLTSRTDRGWYYPLTIKVHPDSKSGFSLFTALGGWLVTLMHGYLNAKWIGKYGKRFMKGYSYLKTPRFWIGLCIYYTGFILIFQQDEIMRNIRNNPQAKRYEIPHGGLWDYSTSGNYLAELICWFGFWVVMDFGPNGAFIFFVSLFNLIPRAATNYEWYVQKFGDEFTSLHRAKLIPGVW